MIYFIQDQATRLIKIGHTTGEAAERLRALQTGCPGGLVLLRSLPGGDEKERELHQRFAGLRDRGEWFLPGPELLAFMLQEPAADSIAGRRWPWNIYLAGKIRKNCWRHSIVGRHGPNLDEIGTCPGGLGENEFSERLREDWPVMPEAIFGIHGYTGPYFVGCDHGCWHGDDTHGIKADRGYALTHYDDMEAGQHRVVQLCCDAIERSDLIFAWIDEGDCWGTAVEIGYAASLKKRIWVAGPRCFRDMWFLYQNAHKTTFHADSASHALIRWLKESAVEECQP